MVEETKDVVTEVKEEVKLDAAEPKSAGPKKDFNPFALNDDDLNWDDGPKGKGKGGKNKGKPQSKPQ